MVKRFSWYKMFKKLIKQFDVEAIVDRVVAQYPLRAEKGNLLFFVGKVMTELRGQENPAVVIAALKKKLKY